MLARGVPGLGSGDVDDLVGSSLLLFVLGLVGLAVLYSPFGPSIPSLLREPCSRLSAFVSCVVSLAVLISLLLSMNDMQALRIREKTNHYFHDLQA